jgi:hypothetical protein
MTEEKWQERNIVIIILCIIEFEFRKIVYFLTVSFFNLFIYGSGSILIRTYFLHKIDRNKYIQNLNWFFLSLYSFLP